MKKSLPGFYPDRLRGTNVVQLHGHLFIENTFRSRKPHKDGPFVLAGRIKNRNQVFNADTLPVPNGAALAASVMSENNGV